MTSQFKQVELFGGAIEAEYPRSFLDVSDLRPVPDNQECYSDQALPNFINVDIMQRVDDEENRTDLHAFKYHAVDLTNNDDFTIAQPQKVVLKNFPNETPALLGFCQSKADALGKYTGIAVLLVRLKEQKTDLVITLILKELEAAVDRLENGVEHGARLQYASLIVNQIRETFKIKNWDLFVPE